MRRMMILKLRSRMIASLSFTVCCSCFMLRVVRSWKSCPWVMKYISVVTHLNPFATWRWYALTPRKAVTVISLMTAFAICSACCLMAITLGSLVYSRVSVCVQLIHRCSTTRIFTIWERCASVTSSGRKSSRLCRSQRKGTIVVVSAMPIWA